MKRFVKVTLSILLVALFSGIQLANASFPGSGTNDIAGVWAGVMQFTGANFVQPIVVTIPSGCTQGKACGDILNLSVQCDWQMVYDGMQNGSYLYHFSNTLSGGCPAVGSGTLTLLPNGTLYRVHYSPNFTASGTLYPFPAGK